MTYKNFVRLAVLAFLVPIGTKGTTLLPNGDNLTLTPNYEETSTCKAVSLPTANLFNFQFNPDGSIVDLSKKITDVLFNRNTTCHQDENYGLTYASFSGKEDSYYAFNFEGNPNIKNAFKSKFTFELLYSPSVTNKVMCPMGAKADSTSTRFEQTADGKILFDIGLEQFGAPNHNRKIHKLKSQTTVQAGEYYHVAVTFFRNGKTNDIIKMYVNGKLECTYEVPAKGGYFYFPDTSHRHIVIGGDFNQMVKENKKFKAGNTELPFYGRILLARMYNWDLKETDIQNLYAATQKQRASYSAKEVIKHNGVGYPETTEQEALKTAIKDYSASKGTLEDDETLIKAVESYKSSTNIVMPENGKAYTFCNVNVNGSKRYLAYQGDSLTWEADNQNKSAFICRKLDNGQYVFVNNAGKYFVWAGKENGYNDNKGYSDTYAQDWCDFSVAKMQTGGNVTTKNIANLFGYLTLQTKNSEKGSAFVTVTPEGNFATQGTASFNNNYSSAILMEEVPYANVVTPKTANEFEDIDFLATFSAPFATVVPEGVTAYYAVSTLDNNNTLVVKPINGDAIPANQGVLLATTSNDALTLCPATTEDMADLSANLLGNTAGAEKSLEAADNAYILGAKNGHVAFYKGIVGSTLPMNRAYLPLNQQLNTVSIKFVNDATGIESVENKENAYAPVYDLSGRRVFTTTKGGIYIQNGKKFIVK